MAATFNQCKEEEFHEVFNHLPKNVKILNKGDCEYHLKKNKEEIKVTKVIQLTLFGDDDLMFLVNDLTVMDRDSLLFFLCPREAKNIMTIAG